MAGAGTRLKAIDHELIQILALQYALAGADNGVAFIGAEPIGLAIGMRRRQLDGDMGANKISIGFAPGYGKIVHGAGSLYPVPGIMRNFKLAERVFLNAEGHNATFVGQKNNIL